MLRTTFITGFPGETEKDHAELVKFVKQMKFERAGVFAYSEEEGTPAALFARKSSTHAGHADALQRQIA